MQKIISLTRLLLSQAGVNGVATQVFLKGQGWRAEVVRQSFRIVGQSREGRGGVCGAQGSSGVSGRQENFCSGDQGTEHPRRELWSLEPGKSIYAQVGII